MSDPPADDPALLARLAASLPDALLSLTPRGLVDSWNAAAERLTDLPRSEVLGAAVGDVLRLEGAGLDIVRDVLADAAVRTREDTLLPRGVPVSIRVGPLPSDDGPQGAVVVLRELTNSTQAAELRRSLELQGVLLREVHHRVKNSLQIVSSLVHLAMRGIEGGRSDPMAALTDVRQRIQAIALLHDQLQSESPRGAVHVDGYLRQLTRRVLQSEGRPGQRVEVVEGGVVLDIQSATPVALVVAELVSNALRHGLGADPGIVTVGVAADHERYELVVTDTGAPFPEGFSPPGDGLGYELVVLWIRQLGGGLKLLEPPEKGVALHWPRSR